MWEYKKIEVSQGFKRTMADSKDAVMKADEPKMLAEMGDEGWELVSAVPAGIFGNITGTLLYFKRHKD